MVAIIANKITTYIAKGGGRGGAEGHMPLHSKSRGGGAGSSPPFKLLLYFAAETSKQLS